MDDQCKYNTYTCYIYNQLQFIDHPKNTLSYSINHALIKSCISQCSFHFNWQTCFSIQIFQNLKSIQLCLQIQFSSVIQLSYADRFSYANQFSYVNRFSYANQFIFALNEFNLCLRYTEYQSHRHGPAGLQAGIKTVL